MRRVPDEACAAICGLFCGACPAFPQECHGCRSDYVREVCRACVHGFRACAAEHRVSHCGLCEDFPCQRLVAFSKGPVIDGICNHENVIPDSRKLKELGTAQWIGEKTKQHTCPQCGELISWFDRERHACGCLLP